MKLEQRLARLSPAQRALLDKRLQAEPVGGHALVARALASLGVTHVYGVPGQPVYDTFAACANEGIRLIGTRHQHPAALMAMAHNYFVGQQNAVSIVSTGVPCANALGAVVVARDNCWPLVVLAGAAPLTASDASYFMDLDGTQLYRSITKWAARVPETRSIPDCIAEAFAVATNGRPGPVLVELPEDVLTGLTVDASMPPLSSSAQHELKMEPSVPRQVTDALISAKRPLLIVGKGARWSSPFTALREFVDVLSIPFTTSAIARGAIPDNHPLCMNAIQWIAQSQADVVVLLGARLDWNLRYGEQLASDATLIQVDIHAPELRHNPRTKIGVHADAGGFLCAVLKQMTAVQRAHAQDQRDHGWVLSLCQLREEVQIKREAQAANDGHRISPLRLAKEIRDALPNNAITIFDSNLTMAACERMIPVQAPLSRLTPGTSGGLGIGIPYAIAAKLVHPDRPVVAICGDFAFGLSAMELETATRHNVPIIIVIANNDGNGGALRQRMHMRNIGPEPVMIFQSGLRYDRIAQVFGGYAQHVERAQDIGPALTRALASNRPACINVAVDPDAPFPRD
jgi:2-hydroxyacyl-CoA lyase 1